MALSLLYGPTLTSIFLMLTGKTITLAIQTFVSKVMSLLFNMVSRFVTSFLPRSKCPLISWLQSPSTEILEPKKIIRHCFHFPLFSHLFATVSTFPPSIRQNNGLDKAQAGIKTARRNINDLRCADDTTLWQKAKRNYRAS